MLHSWRIMTRHRRLCVRPLLSLGLVLALAACGQGPNVQIVLDTTTAELVRGGSVEVLVTLTRTGGAAAELTLSASGLPADVDASFSPATLVGTTLTSTLTLTAAVTAPEGGYEVSVRAAGLGLSATTALDLDVVSLTVTGRVIATYGAPYAGASVSSQGDSAVTDADGTFTLSGLTVPYDLSVWSTADAWVHVYEGLTGTDPVLSPFEAISSSITSTMSAEISGSLTGGAIPVGANQTVRVCVEGVDGPVSGCATVIPGISSYSFTANWLDSASRKVVLHALQVEADGSDTSFGYPGYTSAPLTITHASPVTVDLDLGAALPTETVTVDVETAGTLPGIVAAVQVGPALLMAVGGVAAPDASVDVSMPVIPDASYTFIGGVALQAFGWQAGVTGSTATVTMPGDITLLTPPAAAPNVTTSTTFTVSTTPGTPVTFAWMLDSSDVTVAVTTMASSHTIPNLAPFGLAVPGNAPSTWLAVRHHGPTVDDATNLAYEQTNLGRLFFTGNAERFIGASSLVITPQRAFTTAP